MGGSVKRVRLEEAGALTCPLAERRWVVAGSLTSPTPCWHALAAQVLVVLTREKQAVRGVPLDVSRRHRPDVGLGGEVCAVQLTVMTESELPVSGRARACSTEDPLNVNRVVDEVPPAGRKRRFTEEGRHYTVHRCDGLPKSGKHQKRQRAMGVASGCGARGGVG